MLNNKVLYQLINIFWSYVKLFNRKKPHLTLNWILKKKILSIIKINYSDILKRKIIIKCFNVLFYKHFKMWLMYYLNFDNEWIENRRRNDVIFYYLDSVIFFNSSWKINH